MKCAFRNITLVTFPALALVVITACGGSSSPSSAPPPPTYSIGGTVSGLDTGQSVVLQDNGGDNLPVSANVAFTFATKVASGGAYAVTVSPPTGKTCTVTGGSGTASANVTTVAVACVNSPKFSIGGSVTGLGAGLLVVLQDNGGDDLTVGADGAFAFATKVFSGGGYAVTILTQPQGKYCVVASGTGTASTDVTDVAVACAAPYTVGGTVSGLVGQGLQLELSPEVAYWPTGPLLGISGNGAYVFPGAISPGSSGHGIEIHQQPQSPTQRCVVTHPYFTETPPNVSNISNADVVCQEFAYVANAGAGTVLAFSIAATTGALSSVGPPVRAGRAPSGMASTREKKYLYISDSSSNDVSAFAVDANSGALTTVPGSPFAAGTSPKAVSVYTTTIGTVRGGHVWFNYYLYVANAGSDNLSAYQIDQNTGVPTPLFTPTYATGSGPSVIGIEPRNWILYTANNGGSGDISAFQIDGFEGGLTQVTGSPFPSGGNVSSLAFSANGAFLYAANASGGTATISGFRIQPYIGYATDGTLTPLPGFPYGLPSCSYIVADQTGAYLYAISGTDVLGYSIDAQTGALSLLAGFPIAVGAKVQSVNIDPTNQFLYVAKGSAGTITGFELNGATGALTPMPGSPFAVGASVDFIATF